MRLHRALALGLLCLGLLAGSTFAQNDLLPSESQEDPDYSTGNTYTSDDAPGSTFGAGAIAAQMTVAFTAGTFAGELTSTVYFTNGSDASNGLTFAYVIEHTGAGSQSGPDGIQETNLEFPGFAGWYISDSGADENGDLEPLIINRTATGAPGARWESTTFGGVSSGDGNIMSGDTTSEFWFVVPNARVWSTGTMLIQDGSQVSVAAFVPAPEPGTLALIGGALITLGVIRRRRSKKASA